MSKAGAILMLMVVALWAATPAFACLAPTQAHACCKQMDMPDCDMATLGAAASCCQVEAPDTSGAPAVRAFAQTPVEVAPPMAAVVVPAQASVGARIPLTAETPPPLALTGSSVLRI